MRNNNDRLENIFINLSIILLATMLIIILGVVVYALYSIFGLKLCVSVILAYTAILIFGFIYIEKSK